MPGITWRAVSQIDARHDPERVNRPACARSHGSPKSTASRRFVTFPAAPVCETPPKQRSVGILAPSTCKRSQRRAVGKASDGLRNDGGGLRIRIVGDDGATARELPPHGVAFLLEIEIAVTVVGALAIDVIVDHTEQRFVGECRDRNVDDLPSGHVTSTATTVHAHCI